MGAIYIGIILVLRVAQNFYSKKISNYFPESTYGKAKYLFTYFGIASVICLIVSLATGAFAEVDLLLVVFAVGGGILYLLGMAFTFIAMQQGTMVIASVFGTSGLIIPCIFGIFLFNEPMSVWQWLGIAIFIFAAYLLASSEKHIHSKFTFKKLLILLTLFITEGSIGLSQKLLTFYRPENTNVKSVVFNFISFCVPVVITGAYLLFKKITSGKQENAQANEKLNIKIFYPISVFSVVMPTISMLATFATSIVPSAILFGLINGGNSIIAAIIAAIVYREKPTVRSVSGLIIGICALMIINFF